MLPDERNIALLLGCCFINSQFVLSKLMLCDLDLKIKVQKFHVSLYILKNNN